MPPIYLDAGILSSIGIICLGIGAIKLEKRVKKLERELASIKKEKETEEK